MRRNTAAKRRTAMTWARRYQVPIWSNWKSSSVWAGGSSGGSSSIQPKLECLLHSGPSRARPRLTGTRTDVRPSQGPVCSEFHAFEAPHTVEVVRHVGARQPGTFAAHCQVPPQQSATRSGFVVLALDRGAVTSRRALLIITQEAPCPELPVVYGGYGGRARFRIRPSLYISSTSL